MRLVRRYALWRKPSRSVRVSDAAGAVGWYRRLGSGREWEHRFGPGFPAFACVARDQVRLFLSEHDGDARPDTLLYLRLRDLNAVAEESGSPAEQMPWEPEIRLRDPGGSRLRTGLPAA